MKTIEKISLNQGEFLLWNKTDVLKSEEKRELRKYDLKRGQILGNMYKESIRIIFETREKEQMEVDARVVGVTEQNVILENQAVIPIHRIHHVIV